jgi:hypothetical protein
MPASDPRRAARFLALCALTLALALGAVAARVIWFDAYWLFRSTPPWLGVTEGSNRLLDRQTRRGKVLQALARDYDLALIGSSTTYHGLDPADVDPRAGTAFNLGISALIADELATVAAVVGAQPQVRRATIGLDYYMFSRPTVPVHLDPALATPTGRLTARIGSVVSQYAISDSRISEVTGAEDPGRWTYAGFRVTPPLPAQATQDNDATRRRTTVAYRPETLASLDLALARLAPREVQVYLSPVSGAQRRVLADLGLTDDFERWRADVARTVGARGARFLDLTMLGDDEPFDPMRGSTAAWLDNLHFTPLIGRRVLERLGLRTPPPAG